jgi:hypothetical protein
VLYDRGKKKFKKSYKCRFKNEIATLKKLYYELITIYILRNEIFKTLCDMKTTSLIGGMHI